MDVTVHLDILRLLFTRGMVPTLILVPLSLVLSLVIGLIGGILRVLRLPVLDRIIAAYVAVMRGIPILILLFITYYVLPTGDDPFAAATLALASYHGAYMIEIVRGGFEAIHVGQREAAKSLGLTFWQTVRLVILPQALLIITPAAIGQLVILVKDTAVTSIIGYIEITRMGRNLMQTLLMPLPIFGYIAIYYFIICHFLKVLAAKFEARAHDRIQGKRDGASGQGPSYSSPRPVEV